MRRLAAIWLILTTIFGACAPGQGTSRSQGGQASGEAASAGPKRIVAAMMSDPPTISSDSVTAGSGTIQGGDALEDLVNAGLTAVDNRGNLVPQLASAAPTAESGLWVVFPDGRMETTWRLKDAVWHDGAPFSSWDLAFTTRLGQDRDLPTFGFSGFDAVESVDTPDASTVVVRWKRPYIAADTMFTRRFGFPRPRHVLEATYLENKAMITQHAYWTDGYVGTGAFKVRTWMPGSHLILQANEAYVLGRPKIDELEVRFIPNPNTLVANLLAGQVHLTLGRNLQLSEAMELRDRWTDGTMGIGIKNWIALWVQFINPNPSVLLDVAFRRALLHAIDRQQIVETLEYGMVPIAHTFLSPTDSTYPLVESSIVKYDYDPRRATQLIEGLGYVRRDGIFHDSAGQRLSLDTRTNPGHEQRISAIGDYFRQVGIAAEPFIIPDVRRTDREFNTTFPGVRLWRLPNEVGDISRLHSRDAPLPENRFNGGNRSRYMNAEFDAMIDRYLSTIPHPERVSILAQIIHHMTDQLPVMGIHYNTEPVMISKRLMNVTARDVGETTEAWNAHLWDVK